MLCATIVPIVVSIPDESVEALNVSKKVNDDDDGCANLENTTEKKCLQTPPVSIPS